MKTNFPKSSRHPSQHGSAVFIMMLLLSLMSALIMANVVATRSLDRELKLLDKKQQQQWKKTVPQ